MMKCKICGHFNEKTFTAKILKKYEVQFFHCQKCSFLQTEEPFWLPEAYNQAIKECDTGHLARNIYFSKILTIFISLFLDKSAQFLDFAGGYGIFTRLMRDVGFDYLWDDKYTENIFAKGFEASQSSGYYEAITMFECLEHFSDPLPEIDNILKSTNTLVCSTQILPAFLPDPKNWWYYLFDEGQHISFFSEKTLRFIANELSLSYASFGNLHFFSKKLELKRSKLCVLGLYRFGLHKLCTLKMKSKTISDFDLAQKRNKTVKQEIL